MFIFLSKTSASRQAESSTHVRNINPPTWRPSTEKALLVLVFYTLFACGVKSRKSLLCYSLIHVCMSHITTSTFVTFSFYMDMRYTFSIDMIFNTFTFHSLLFVKKTSRFRMRNVTSWTEHYVKRGWAACSSASMHRLWCNLAALFLYPRCASVHTLENLQPNTHMQTNKTVAHKCTFKHTS